MAGSRTFGSKFHFRNSRRRSWWNITGFIALMIVIWMLFANVSLRWLHGGEGGNVFTQDWRSYRSAFNLSEFGGVGDGVTLNTKAFEEAVRVIAERGGGQLNVEPGLWLTAPFNLTSHMTLFLMKGATILAVEDESKWPLMPPLPSYGHGREHKGARYGSLIQGQYLEDVVITGQNGTIDGQGNAWWVKFQKKRLEHTRGPLVEIMWSKDIIISNITMRDSPFWTVHLYVCDNVTVSHNTILAPLLGAPNTDGIDPDSCTNVAIENNYISVGDDAIAIKSGWDQYGMSYGKPSANISVRNVTLRTTVSAGISIGSEMSGGVSNITIENIHVWGSKRGIRIKTAPGRGGYIRGITCRNITFNNVLAGFVVKTDYNEHPEGFDPQAIPIIENITFDGIYGRDVRIPVRIQGSKEIPVRGVNIRNMNVSLKYNRKRVFQCAYVEGEVILPIYPEPCKSFNLYNEYGKLVKHAVPENVTYADYSF
ncbi:probable polygalacturonase [Typha angustifolia]|uniref:probable polygalacturonase n=1 Tax=Typha angustifolia TaxID=59011 RepID=UPI003C2AE026